MTLPSQSAIRGPLLVELLRVGGSIKPSEIYDSVASHFPGMTGDEREAEMDCGHNVFNNRVQWARQRLVDEGMIDPSVRGVWRLTEAGKAEAVLAAAEARSSQAPLSISRSDVTLVDLLGAHDRDVRAQLASLLRCIPAKQFEVLCGQLLRAMGFRDVKVTQYSGDGGIDGEGSLKVGIVSVKAAFQCKRWKADRSIGRPDIDAFRGATQGKYDQAIFLATTTFSDQARSESLRAGCIPIVMIDCDAVISQRIDL